MRRRGVTAIEVVIGGVLLLSMSLPIMSLLRGSQKVAFLDEFQVLARRQALRTFAVLQGKSYAQLVALATGGAPPIQDPRLEADSKELVIPFNPGADITLENLPAAAQEVYASRLKKMPVQAFFSEMSPGFGRLAVLVAWEDPSSGTSRHIVLTRFVEDPFLWEEGR